MSAMDPAQADVERNLAIVKARMADAAQRAGRDPSGVRLVAISKLQPLAKVVAAYRFGQREFGENRVQEGIEKQRQLSGYSDIRWHMVGHIQSRKADEAALNFDVIHSVDRLKLARRLDQACSTREARLPVYLEMNVSGEESKEGWDFSQREVWRQMITRIEPVFDLAHLQVIGLMTMAPWVEDKRVLRSTFSSLRGLRDFIGEVLNKELPQLSMGMTDDYEIAIEEGATVVRVGRAVFGERI